MPEIACIAPPSSDPTIGARINALIKKYEEQLLPKENEINERATGQFLIEPLLNALGWDTTNPDEVFPEFPVSGVGRVDYVLKVNKYPVVYVEIKPIASELDESRDGRTYEEQAMDYAWKKRATWAILTNFKELRLYNAKERVSVFPPVLHNSFVTNFDATLRYLTKDNVVKGLLGQLYALKAGREIDKDFLADLQKWRLTIANSIHKDNPNLTLSQISSETQRVLNRLLLIRIAEDKGILSRGTIRNSFISWQSNPQRVRRKKFIDELREIFVDFEFDFNTDLFKEHLCDKLIIDNRVLKNVIEPSSTNGNSLYDYDFSTYNADILGSTYELYLGSALEPVDEHIDTDHVPQEIDLKVDIKRELKQRGGVYYTRPPIVDFIVSQTVLRKIKERINKKDMNITVLDTAAGSGSFALKAFCALRNHYISIPSEKTTRNKSVNQEWEILTESKIIKNILTNNLFLVDIDKDAIEVAKLNLWAESLRRPHGDAKGLQDLENSVKRGNSLVYLNDEKLQEYFGTLGDLDAIKQKIVPFDWNKEFPHVFANGGFDVIIGNPPYYTIKDLDRRIPGLKKYLEDFYNEIHTYGNDILYYFFYRTLSLLKEDGILGFITARYWMEAADAEKLRKFIKENFNILTIIDFGNIDMFGGLGTRTAVFILERHKKKKPTNIIQICRVRTRRYRGTKRELVNHIEKHLGKDEYKDQNICIFPLSQEKLDDELWRLVSEKEYEFMDNLTMNCWKLTEICDVGQGMITGSARFVVDSSVAKTLEESLLKKLVKNSDIERFSVRPTDKYLIYTENITAIESYPKTYEYLKNYYEELKPEDENKKGRPTITREEDWYKFSRPQNKELFDKVKEKIVVPYIAPSNTFAFDDEEYYNDNADVRVIVRNVEKCKQARCEVDLRYILGVLNSNLLTYYHIFNSKKKDYRYEYYPNRLELLPIPKLDLRQQTQKEIHDYIVTRASDIIAAKKKVFTLEKEFNELLSNNPYTEIKFKEFYRYATEYGVSKRLLREDIEVMTAEIDLESVDNKILIKAYFDEDWEDIVELEFSDSGIRDFLYLSLRKYLLDNETKTAWRKGKIIQDVIMSIGIPQFDRASAADVRVMCDIIVELRKGIDETNLGVFESDIRVKEKEINIKVYNMLELTADEIDLIEESIGYGKPYLRF